MDHADCVDEAADALRHADGFTAVQRVTELLQCVQILHVVLGFVRRVRQFVILQVPRLQHRHSKISMSIVRSLTV